MQRKLEKDLDRGRGPVEGLDRKLKCLGSKLYLKSDQKTEGVPERAVHWIF